jgi:hypothetical protein
VRLFVGRTPLIIQAFESGAIGGQRTPSIGRDPVDQTVERHIEPHGHAVRVDRGPVLAVDERSTAGCHHQVPPGNLFHERLSLGRAEVSFALA